MKALNVFLQLEEIAQKIPKGINKFGYQCVKSEIEKVNNLFSTAYTGDDPALLLRSANRMIKLYIEISNKSINVETNLTTNHKTFLNSLKALSDSIPLGTPVEYLGNTEPCFKSIIDQLIEYFNNDLIYSMYSIDYQKHFKQIDLLSKAFHNKSS